MATTSDEQQTFSDAGTSAASSANQDDVHSENKHSVHSSRSYVSTSDKVFVNFGIPARSIEGIKQRKLENAVSNIFFIFNGLFVTKTFVLMTVAMVYKANPIKIAMQTLLTKTTTVKRPLNYEAVLLLLWLSLCASCIGIFSCRFSLVRYKKHMKMYVIAMIIVCVGEIVVGILASISHRQIGNIKEEHLLASLNLKDYKKASIQKAWDVLHVTLYCCGSRGPKDFDDIYKQKNISIPHSCCINNLKDLEPVVKVSECQEKPYNRSNPYVKHKGCHKKLIRTMKTDMSTLIAISIGMSLFQWIGIGFGFILIFFNHQFTHRY